VDGAFTAVDDEENWGEDKGVGEEEGSHGKRTRGKGNGRWKRGGSRYGVKRTNMRERENENKICTTLTSLSLSLHHSSP
jgi:hypothetical protein